MQMLFLFTAVVFFGVLMRFIKIKSQYDLIE